MNIATKQSTNHQNTLVWAIICSILLHVLFAVVIPNIKLDKVKKPVILVVNMVAKPEPPPVALPKPVEPQPEQPKPEPIKPKVETKPIVKPLPVTTVIKDELSANAPPLPPTQPSPKEVIAVAPTSEAPPSNVVAAPLAPADVRAANGDYGSILWSAISKHKQYPRIAQMRGWQGEAIVELQLDGNGKLKSKKIIQSSGYDALDKQALLMVDKASPFPLPPEALRGSNFSITVPIPFKLE